MRNTVQLRADGRQRPEERSVGVPVEAALLRDAGAPGLSLALLQVLALERHLKTVLVDVHVTKDMDLRCVWI